MSVLEEFLIKHGYNDSNQRYVLMAMLGRLKYPIDEKDRWEIALFSVETDAKAVSPSTMLLFEFCERLVGGLTERVPKHYPFFPFERYGELLIEKKCKLLLFKDVVAIDDPQLVMSMISAERIPFGKSTKQTIAMNIPIVLAGDPSMLRDVAGCWRRRLLPIRLSQVSLSEEEVTKWSEQFKLHHDVLAKKCDAAYQSLCMTIAEDDPWRHSEIHQFMMHQEEFKGNE